MAGRKQTNKTPEKRRWEDKFLSVFADCGVVGYACAAAGIGRATVYARREASPAFARRWAEAEEAATEGLEREAMERAKRKSDLLLIFLLKARRPDVYRENVSVKHSGSVSVDLLGLGALSDDELEARAGGGEDPPAIPPAP